MVTMSDTRGTQTDLIADRNIAECLMELRSKAEFQDLSYRLSRSCTGEMTLTVTRESLLGLLGAPFDPMSVTVTASAVCYISVLFTPVEIIHLKEDSGRELNLRKFRSVLWKLTGRAGYGFCPGFKDSDFPPRFHFEAHGLQVLQQPFRRIQSQACSVFVQQRRASSRAASQPLQLKLCPSCFETLTNIFMSFKTSGQDLSVAAFAKFLLFDSSSPRSVSQRTPQTPPKNKMIEGSVSSRPLGGNEATHTEQVGENGDTGEPADSTEVQGEGMEEKPSSKMPAGKLSSNKLTMRDCSVLLDRVLPRTTSRTQIDCKGNTSKFSSSSASSLAPLAGGAAITASYSLETLASTSAPSRPSLAGVGRLCIQTSGESTSTRPILSARIKPFRKEIPPEKDTVDMGLVEGSEADMMAPGERVTEGLAVAEAVTSAAPSEGCVTDPMDMAPSGEPSRQADREEASPETGPPVLTPEVALSPDSPQPLLIDEEAGQERGDAEDTAEPDSKRVCLRCPQCAEAFSSEAQLNHHTSHHHQTPAPVSSTSSQVVMPGAEGTELGGSSGEQEGSSPVRSCPICHTTFPSKKELEEHLITRHGARLHPCRYCGQKFALKKNLADHLQRHRGVGMLTCKECGQRFSKKKLFAAHVREHMGSFPYFCTICSRMFSREKAYEEHVARHRARRGVHAVLEGSQRATQSIMSKAKKFLEEKALLTPTLELPSLPVSSQNTLSSSAQPLPSAPSLTVTQSPSTESSSTQNTSPAFQPDSLASASSNLLLLSAVSLAQAQYDRQLGQEGPRAEQAGGQLSVQTPESSCGSHGMGSAKGEATSSGSRSQSTDSLSRAGSVPTGDSSPSHSSQVNLLLQQLNGPVPSTVSTSDRSQGPSSPSPSGQRLTAPKPTGTEKTQSSAASCGLEMGKTSSLHPTATSAAHFTRSRRRTGSKEKEEVQPPAGPSALTDPQHSTETAELTDRQCSAEPAGPTEGEEGKEKSEAPDGQEATSPRDKELKEREEKLCLKEEELKERERAITRKNMMLFQQLLLAHITQQQKTSNTPNPAHGKVDKPTPQQALAMFTALNTMAARAVGGAPIRLPTPVTAKASAVHGKVGPSTDPGDQGVAAVGSRPGNGAVEPTTPAVPATGPLSSPPASDMVPAAAAGTQAGSRTHPAPACPTTSTLSGPAGPKPNSLSFRSPPSPAILPAMSQTSAAPSGSTSMNHRWKQSQGAGLSQSPFFLQELMKLEAKMPASAKAFMPPPPPKPAPVPSIHRTHLISPGRRASAHGADGGQGTGMGAGHGNGSVGGGESSSSQEDGGKARGKRGTWSGGLVKEKLTSVPTVVSLHEMQRLMALTQACSPVGRAHRSPSLSPKTPSGSTAMPSPAPSSAASPAAPPSESSSQTPQPVTASPSPAGSTSPAALPSVLGDTRMSSPTGTSSSPTVSATKPLTQSPRPSRPPYIPPVSGTPKSVVVDVDLPSMPPLIPASIVEHAAASSWPSLQDRSSAKAKDMCDNVEPIDLTKGSDGRSTASSGGAVRNDVRPVAKNSKVRPPQTKNDNPSNISSENTQQAVTVSHAVSDLKTSEGRAPAEREDQGVQATAGRFMESESSPQGAPGLSATKSRAEGAQRALPSAVAQNGREAWPRAPQEIRLLSPEGVALLQHLMPSGTREGSAKRSPATCIPQSALLQMMPSPQMVRSVRAAGMAGKILPHTAGPQRLFLPAQSPVRPASHSVPSPAVAVVTSAPTAAGVVPCSRATDASVSSATSSLPGSPQTSTAPHKNLQRKPPSPKTPAQPAATDVQSGSPGVQQVSSTESRGQGKQQTPHPASGGVGEKGGQAVSPLGGFTWHRPAPVHPDCSQQDPHNMADPQRDIRSQGQEVVKERSKETQMDREMRADHNLWQQQFLATLREKRRQKEEQQQRQQQQAQQHIAQSPNQSVSPVSGQQEAKKRKTSEVVTQAVTRPTAGHHEDTSVERAGGHSHTQAPHPPSTMPVQPPSPLPLSSSSSTSNQSQASGPRTRRAAGSRAGQSRGRARNRKKNPRSAAPAPADVPLTDQGQGEGGQAPPEEGSQLQGFGSDGQVKLEPLEAGVRCDDCGHVFFNETDILEHDCDGP